MPYTLELCILCKHPDLGFFVCFTVDELDDLPQYTTLGADLGTSPADVFWSGFYPQTNCRHWGVQDRTGQCSFWTFKSSSCPSSEPFSHLITNDHNYSRDQWCAHLKLQHHSPSCTIHMGLMLSSNPKSFPHHPQPLCEPMKRSYYCCFKGTHTLFIIYVFGWFKAFLVISFIIRMSCNSTKIFFQSGHLHYLMLLYM